MSTPRVGVTVHPADETTANFLVEQGGELVFRAPDGSAWPLARPAMATGSDQPATVFHPMAPAEVDAAIRGIQFPLEGIRFDVFVLPYPIKGFGGSLTIPGAVLLAPGTRDYTADEVHFVVSHEVGHVVQNALLPDADTRGWERYRALRGIADPAVYFAGADHADRPHEIFAEDFRFLFGDAASRSTGTIENSALPLPTEVAGLRAFLLALPASPAPTASLALASGPNPFRDRTQIVFRVGAGSGSTALAQAGQPGNEALVTVEVFGADGRRVRTLVRDSRQPGSYSASFDGRDDAGRLLPAGVWFARLQAGGESRTLKLLLSR